MFLVTKERMSTNIIKKTPYITILPTLIQIESTNFTYLEINFGIELFFETIKIKIRIIARIKIIELIFR